MSINIVENESFTEMKKYLKDKNIKNYNFMSSRNKLAVFLLDPYDEYNLTEIQQNTIYEECRENFWYFLEKVVRIPELGGGTKQYKLNPFNMSLNWNLLQNKNIISMSSRQLYSTCSLYVYFFWKMYFDINNTYDNIVFVDAEKCLLNRFLELYNKLPYYLKRKINKNINNIYLYRGDKQKYLNLDNSIYYISEYQALENNKTFLDKILKNKNCQVIVEITPTLYRNEWILNAKKLEESCTNIWSEDMYDKENLLNKEFCLIKYRYDNIILNEKDQEYYYNTMCSVLLEEQLVKSEVLLEWE